MILSSWKISLLLIINLLFFTVSCNQKRGELPSVTKTPLIITPIANLTKIVPTLTAQNGNPLATSILLTVTPTPIPLGLTPPPLDNVDSTVKAQNGNPLATSILLTVTPTPIPPLNIVDSTVKAADDISKSEESFILFVVEQNGTQFDKVLALKSLPLNSAFSLEVFDTFYGPAFGNGSLDMYFIDFAPQQSPDGRYLLLPGAGGGDPNPNGDLGSGLWLVDLLEKESRQILPQAKIASWSPDSKKIAYADNQSLKVINIEGQQEPITLFSQEGLNEILVKWSPDGQWIAIMGTLESGEMGYWLIPAEGGDPHKVALRLFGQFHSAGMSWSSDSRYLLLRNAQIILDIVTGDLLYIVRLPGSLQWLPGIDHLLSSGTHGMFKLTVFGKFVENISNSEISALAVSSDGKRVAYGVSEVDGGTSLFIADMETASSQLIGTVFESGSQCSAPCSLRTLSWYENDTKLIFDDFDGNTPIWVISTEPGSFAEPVLEQGMLIGVFKLP